MSTARKNSFQFISKQSSSPPHFLSPFIASTCFYGKRSWLATDGATGEGAGVLGSLW